MLVHTARHCPPVAPVGCACSDLKGDKSQEAGLPAVGVSEPFVTSHMTKTLNPW